MCAHKKHFFQFLQFLVWKYRPKLLILWFEYEVPAGVSALHKTELLIPTNYDK